MANNVPLHTAGRHLSSSGTGPKQHRADWDDATRTATRQRPSTEADVDLDGGRRDAQPESDPVGEALSEEQLGQKQALGTGESRSPERMQQRSQQRSAVTEQSQHRSGSVALGSVVVSPDLAAPELANSGQSPAATSTPDRSDHISSDSTQARAQRTKSRDSAAKTPVLVPLSERDSIFATHYLPADALSSPRSDGADVELSAAEAEKAPPAMAVLAGVPFARNASLVALPPASIATNGNHDLSQTLKDGNVISGTVDLVPYKHQAGGHAHLYHFSGKAICKALSNRENEFYEIVEQTKPELLVFLPRYIGVINVTLRTPAHGNSNAPTLTNGSFVNASDAIYDTKSEERLTNGTHMVDQSQQTAPIPQVILANNRHIIDDSLLGIDSSLDKPVWTSDESLDLRLSESDGTDVQASPRSTKSVKSMLTRPKMPSSSHSSWGATTVNTKLKDQVLREVFGKRQSFLGTSESSSGLSRSLPKPGHVPSLPHRRGSEDLGSKRDDMGKRPSLSPHNDDSERSRSTNDIRRSRSNELARVKVEAGDGTNELLVLPLGREKTIPAGPKQNSALTMQLNQLAQNPEIIVSPNDEAYHADHEDEASDLPVKENNADMGTQTDIATKTFSVTSPISKNQILTVEEVFPSLPAPSLAEPHHFYHQPLNPEEAQFESQTSSQDKVEHFLLLENLTAGMKRPCVLDLKMGTRQYGIWASDKKRRSQRKKCKMATSVELGVRVNGMRVWNVKSQRYIYEDKYYGRDLKPGREFQETLRKFLYDGITDSSVLSHIPVILEKIARLETMIKDLKGYRFYGSSLLLIYDGANPGNDHDGHSSSSSDNEMSNAMKAASIGLKRSRIDIKIVDFANCLTANHKIPADAPFPPKNRDGIDRGYLRGLRSLKLYFQRIWRDINHEDWIDRGEGEGVSHFEPTGRINSEPVGTTDEDDGDVSI